MRDLSSPLPLLQPRGATSEEEKLWKQDGGGVGGGNPGEFNTSVCICPTQGPSLQVTFPCSPEGLPAKEATPGLPGQPTAPARPFPGSRSPFAASGRGLELGPKPASPTPVPGVRRLSQPNSRAPSPPPRRGSSQRPCPLSGRPLPHLQRPVRRGRGKPFLSSPPPPLSWCPPGAAPFPGPSPLRAAASQVLPTPPRSRADTV